MKPTIEQLSAAREAAEALRQALLKAGGYSTFSEQLRSLVIIQRTLDGRMADLLLTEYDRTTARG